MVPLAVRATPFHRNREVVDQRHGVRGVLPGTIGRRAANGDVERTNLGLQRALDEAKGGRSGRLFGHCATLTPFRCATKGGIWEYPPNK